MLTYKTEIRVRFCETDKMQFLHHAKYVEYFEVARTEMLRFYGMPYKWIEENGYEMPVMEIGVKYKNAAFYDDVLVCEASIKDFQGVKVHIEYKVYKKETGVVCALGFSDLAFIKMDTKKATRPPQFYLDAVRKLMEQTV
jgi:acyl-CoA thioester hydrolase